MKPLKTGSGYAACLLVLTFCFISNASAESVQLEMTRANSGNLYVHARLGSDSGDTETDLLVDTGAGYVSLSESTFKRLNDQGEPVFSRFIFGAMANGKV